MTLIERGLKQDMSAEVTVELPARGSESHAASASLGWTIQITRASTAIDDGRQRPGR